jgi:hypothetical protein
MSNGNLIFKSDVTVNIIHALMSVLFIDSVYSEEPNGDLVPLTIGGMFESSVAFDNVSDRINQAYFSKVINYFNEASASGGSPSKQDNSKNNRFRSKNNKSSNFKRGNGSSMGGSPLQPSTNLDQDTPSGGRSYSSLINRSPYLIEYSRDGTLYSISFSSFDELKLFFRQEIENIK